MARIGEKGFSAIPVALIICVLIASCAAALGIRGLDRAESLQEEQKAINSFEEFVRTAKEVGYGRVGGSQKIELKLGPSRIEVEQSLAELRRGNEVLRSESLLLPIVLKGMERGIIRRGIYKMELLRPNDSLHEKKEQDLLLVLRRMNP